MPRTLITGGAGFIGSHLCDRFIAEGHDVLCMDNLITGSKDNIAHLLDHPRFTFILHDVTRYIEVQGPLDHILHFASPASPKDFARIPIQILKVGALGCHNVLGLARAKGAQVTIASTSEVYGDPLVNPQPETYLGNVDPIGVRGVYDEAKRFAEAITTAYHRIHGVDIRIVRIFNTYGERMQPNDGRALPNFICQALRGDPITVYGDGQQTRSFGYVSDLIDGIRLLMDSDVTEPVNLGNPVEVSLIDVAKEVQRLIGGPSEITFHPLPPGDPKVRRPDITRARERLGWEPKIDRREGFRKTIDDFERRVGRSW